LAAIDVFPFPIAMGHDVSRLAKYEWGVDCWRRRTRRRYKTKMAVAAASITTGIATPIAAFALVDKPVAL
jgi:hypothetical protein